MHMMVLQLAAVPKVACFVWRECIAPDKAGYLRYCPAASLQKHYVQSELFFYA